VARKGLARAGTAARQAVRASVQAMSPSGVQRKKGRAAT
jgi:hypothetical protein